MLPASYTAVHRYDGAMLQRGKRQATVECQLTPRDVAIIRDVWRYRFMTTEQLNALRFTGITPQAVRRRLAKLFGAGHLERFRPYSRRGSYPWTYHLCRAGHKLLQEAGHIEPGARYQPRTLHDYSYVIHDLQLNAWILAYRHLLDGALLEWHGETALHPPRETRRGQRPLGAGWTAQGLKDQSARPVFPDAVLEIKRADGRLPWTLLLEHDRTRRVDKNFDKFRRYDYYLTAWHPFSRLARPGGDEPAPFVLFVCQDDDQRDVFMHAADHELTGYRWQPSAPDEHQYVGRQRILFATELDIHTGTLEARRLSPYPPKHPARHGPEAEDAASGFPGRSSISTRHRNARNRPPRSRSRLARDARRRRRDPREPPAHRPSR